MTQSVLAVLQRSRDEALRRHHRQLSPLHLLKALFAVADWQILHKCLGGVSREKLEDLCDLKLSALPEVHGGSGMSLSRETAALLDRAQERAAHLGDRFISLDNIIFCVLTGDPVKSLFSDCGGDPGELERIIGEMRMNKTVDSETRNRDSML
jgi:ATP-dependent Clp protease ATP-binding subunit ClpA